MSRRKKIPFKRWLIKHIFSFFDFDEDLNNSLDTWPMTERRSPENDYHLIGDRRARTWLERAERLLGLESPNPARTVRVHVTTVVATVQVLLIVLVTLEGRFENLLLLPVFCIYAAAILTLRNYRIKRLIRTTS